MNPELRRLFWLELTPTRLILLPAILGLCILIAFGSSFDQRVIFYSSLVSIGVAGFLILSAWGIVSSSRCFLAEVRKGTWDSLRMSSMAPWSLAWPRVLGGAAAAWYGRGLLLVVAVIGAIGSGHYDIVAIFKFTLLLVFFALLGEALALVFALESAPRLRRSKGGSEGMNPMLLILPFALVQLSAFTSLKSGINNYLNSINFWGVSFNVLDFLLLSTAVYLIWSGYGLLRKIRGELQIPVSPFFLPALIVFLAFYITPFAAGVSRALGRGSELQMFLPVLAIISIIFAYLLILIEDKNGTRLLRFIDHRGDFPRALIPVPGWLTCLAIGFVAVFCKMLQDFTGAIYLVPAASLVSFLLFATRDVALFLYVHFKHPNSNRNDITAIIYLVILYLLIPFVCRLFLPVELMSLFYPSPGASYSSALLGLPGCAIVLMLLARKVKALMQYQRQSNTGA